MPIYISKDTHIPHLAPLCPFSDTKSNYIKF